MSATVMRYPSQWAKLVPVVRSIIGDKHADVKVGIGLNFNHLNVVDSQYYSNSAQALDPSDGYWLGSGQRAVSPSVLQSANAFGAPPVDGAVVRRLVSEVIDFVGVSAYAPYSGPAFSRHEFETPRSTLAMLCGVMPMAWTLLRLSVLAKSSCITANSAWAEVKMEIDRCVLPCCLCCMCFPLLDCMLSEFFWLRIGWCSSLLPTASHVHQNSKILTIVAITTCCQYGSTAGQLAALAVL